MTSSTSAVLPAHSRQAYLSGLAIGIAGAVLFSAKAIVAKLICRYHVDAVTLIACRMLFSLPFFAAVAVWKARTEPALESADVGRVTVLGLLGYYLSSFLYFLGLQTISAGLERLILFLTPSFVLLISVAFLKKKITMPEWGTLHCLPRHGTAGLPDDDCGGAHRCGDRVTGGNDRAGIDTVHGRADPR